MSLYDELPPVDGLDAPAGTITRAFAELEQIARDFGDALHAEHPAAATINPYRLFEGHMHLPAVWHWLVPSSTTDPDPCEVEDRLRVVVNISTLPAASAGEDALELMRLADAYLPLLDARRIARGAFGAKRARRTGIQMVSEQLGNEAVLTFEVSLELELANGLEPT